ncbi:MAG: saccharopine dehydrogenase NADP-binding domain-containing protein [Pirellulales bacterium]
MKRIIVVGGLGQFGRTIAEQLRRRQLPVQIASRSATADLQVDANDAASIRSALRPGDLVIDAAGPFDVRSTALVEAATDLGCDVIDINDDLRYAEAILRLERRIESAGIRVLSSASTVSAVAAAVVQHSGIATPHRVTVCLVPASHHSANAGAALSLIRSLGRLVRVLRDGRLQEQIGWRESRRFQMPAPLGTVNGRLFESADVVYLPRIWPTLRDAAMYVDTNIPGVNSLLRLAARWPAARHFLERHVDLSTRIARTFGRAAGGVGYEIEDAGGRVARYAVVSDKNSFVTAVAPAVLAARAIAEGRFPRRGLVLPDRQVEPPELFAFLQAAGITICQLS